MFTAQLDLFDDRHLVFNRARSALADGQVERARHELIQLLRRYPDDPSVAFELARSQTLLTQLTDADLLEGTRRAEAYLDLAENWPDGEGLSGCLRRSLLRRAAEALQAAGGDTCLLRDVPCGYYFLASDDLDAAQASLVRAGPRARFTAILADVHHARGDVARARRLYCEVLLRDPFDVVFELVRDSEVRDLPDLAAAEFELPEPLAWAGAVGLTLGILPMVLNEDVSGWPPPTGAGLAQMDALAAARRFAAALFRVRSPEHAVDARRTMKHIAPGLFSEYLSRRAR